MGSFSAVTNFRSDLSSRWRHSLYRFSSVGHFKYLVVEKSVSRFATRSLVPKLGLYFSHFIFSDNLDISGSGFFFDFSVDRRYRRFSKSIIATPRKKQFFRRAGSAFKFSSKPYSMPVVLKPCRLEKGLLGYVLPKLQFILSSSWQFFVSRKYTLTKLVNSFSRLQFRILRFGVFSGFRFFLKYNGARDRKLMFASIAVSAPSSVTPNRSIRNKVHFFSVFCLQRFLCVRFSKLKRVNLFARFFRVRWPRGTRWRYLATSYSISDLVTQLRFIFGSCFKFFFSYYFRYYPYRFLKIFKLSSFYYIRRSKGSLNHLGLRLRWLYLGRRSISKWLFDQVYSGFLRKRNFFYFLQNYKAINFKFYSINRNMRPLVSLSRFGTLPSGLISQIFAYRLKRRERVNPVLYSMIRLVLARKRVLGLVILRNGRFTKRQRAIHSFYRAGRVSYNSYVMPIDYSISTAILKYSMVAIRIWISAAPAVRFLSHNSIGDSGGAIYPSSLVGFLVRKYLYTWRVFNSFR
jgi:hypothetical protein